MSIKLFAATLAACFALALVGVTSASGQPEYQEWQVEVTKVVEFAGDSSDKSFVVDVCGQSINFDEDGGTQTVDVDESPCIVSEPDDGGATSVEIEGSPCEFEEVKYETTTETVYEPQVCSVVIENSFDEPTTTTTTAPPVVIQEPPVIIEAPAPAPVIVRTPVFTG